MTQKPTAQSPTPPILYADQDAWCQGVAERLSEYLQTTVSRRGVAHLALAGGSTPRNLYETLAQEPFRSRIPWQQLHIYFGDERCVPAGHPDSNFRMAREALLAHVPIPGTQVHGLEMTLGTIRQDAACYANTLNRCITDRHNTLPRLDLVLLGVGNDGHTASLFPNTCILHERNRTVSAVHVPQLNTWRISFTYPLLQQAHALWVLVTGTGKADIMARVFHEPQACFPVQRLAPLPQLEWHLDQAAAAKV